MKKEPDVGRPPRWRPTGSLVPGASAACAGDAPAELGSGPVSPARPPVGLPCGSRLGMRPALPVPVAGRAAASRRGGGAGSPGARRSHIWFPFTPRGCSGAHGPGNHTPFVCSARSVLLARPPL